MFYQDYMLRYFFIQFELWYNSLKKLFQGSNQN
mgnify:CR=1 FL=1